MPSGESARSTIGPVWPSSTLSGFGLPGVQSAMCASAPAVAMRPSFSQMTAFTASSWKRITCSATLRVSDQRMAAVSKLPEMACVAVGRDRHRAHRPAMAAQLRLRRAKAERHEQEGESQAFDTK